MEVDLAVIDNGVVPVDYVDGALRPHLDIHRAERSMAGVQHGLHLARGVAATVFLELITHGAVGAEIIGEQTAAPVFGHVIAGDKFRGGVFGFAGDQAAQHTMRAHGGGESRAGENIVRTGTAGTVGAERLPPAIERETPRVDHTHGIRIEPFLIGPEPPNAAAVHPARAVHGVDEGVDVNGLREMQVAPRRPAQAVDHVVHVGVAEAGENDAPRLGLVIAIRIGEENKLRRTANIRAAFHRHH